jgi:4-amino-4-deoxy-L-arabinose transferase-like glycosyltransferase
MTEPPAQSGNGHVESAAATSSVATDTPARTELKPWLPEAESRAGGAVVAKQETAKGEKFPSNSVSRLWRGRGIWLGIAALVLSFTVTLLLARDEPVRTWAALGIVASGLVGIVTWGSTPWLPAIVKPLNVWPFGPFSLERMVRLLGIVVAGELVWWGNVQFAANQYERFGLAGVLWVASMVVLVVSVVGWPVPGQPGLFGRFSRPPASAVVASAGEVLLRTTTPMAGVSSSLPVRPRHGTSRTPGTPLGLATPARWTRWEVLLFVGIVALAVVVRVWDLQSIPYAINPDEILTGREANQTFLVPNNISIFQTVWTGIDLPAFWFLIVAQFMKLGDSTLAALRLPSALFGVAAVIPFYFMLRSVWGRVGAITGTSILAFGVASVHFSRLAVNNGVTVFFWTTCFFFLLRALRRGRPIDWVLSGIAGGLSEHFYYGTRLLPFVLLAFGGYLQVVHWSRVRYYILCFPLLALGYMAALGPLVTWFSTHPDLYLGQKVGARPLTWNHLPVSLDDLANMWNTLWPLFSQNLLTLSTLPATDAFYFAPMLLPFEAALLALGVGLLIWRWRQPAAFLFLVSGFGVLLAGGTLVPFAGNVNHWTPAFPSIYAAVALPVVGVAWAIGRYGKRAYRYVGVAALGCLIVVLGLSNVTYYLT